MKKALKIIAFVFGAGVLAVAVLFFIFLNKLPSAYQIKQAVSPKQGSEPQFAEPSTESSNAALPEKSNSPETAVTKTQEERVDEGKELSRKAIHEDFMNERQPLASVCSHLARAPDSRFLRAEENANSKEFLKKLTSEDKDPLIEAAAPAFRFVFRLPQMKNLIDMVEKAQAEHANELLQKAGFYTQLGLTANAIRLSKPELDQVLMKSYNMYILAKAVAKNPTMARDPAALAFCDQIEKNINNDLEFNADQQATELQKFLEYAKVSPTDIGYDANYRSDVTFKFSNSSILMENIWVEKLFAEDMRKAGKEIEKSLPPPAESSHEKTTL